ncbi:DUF2726 domain-containing protein [Vibrio sp. YIC-376]|uniref:DUF2726 domain-containing protein n=1 Tax=Vibrio sp. YIC-376 TaxID=3136162 RepID=UPI00402AFD1D
MFEIVIVLFLVLIAYTSMKSKKSRHRGQLKPFVGSGSKRVTTFPTVTKKPAKPSFVPHKKHIYLNSKTERNFYQVLQEILPSDYVVHCQVSLMALVQPLHFKDNSRTWAKRMDYVITDRNTKILAVIELDDSSHRQKKRQERDFYVNSALEGHHKLLRFEATGKYDPIYVANVIERDTEITCNPLVTVAQLN